MNIDEKTIRQTLEAKIPGILDRINTIPLENSPNLAWGPARAFLQTAIEEFIEGHFISTICCCRAAVETALETKTGINGFGGIQKIEDEKIRQNIKFVEEWGHAFAHADREKMKKVARYYPVKTNYPQEKLWDGYDSIPAKECLIRTRKIFSNFFPRVK